jgi:uncharacterized protein (TIGR02453 family)
MMNKSDFDGFGDGTFRFLRGLAKNNDKAWFEAHRADYDEHYVEAAKGFVSALGPKLRKVSKSVQFEPRVNGSLFRINRDVRFSKDKTPYKAHLDLWFWEGDRRGWDTPGFFFRLAPDRLILGAGMHKLEKPALEKYREAVLDDKLGKELEKVLAKIRAHGQYAVGGATRKTVPRGFDAAHPRASLLLHEGLHAELDTKVPPEAKSGAFVEYCAKRFADVAPINRWIAAALGRSPTPPRKPT